jgi:hypothetical protein
MADYWFEPKEQGYGAVPINGKGLALTLIFAVAVIAGSLAIIFTFRETWLTPVLGLFYILALVVAFLRICRRKTNGPWRWR